MSSTDVIQHGAVVRCPQVDIDFSADWSSIARAFAHAPAFEYGQFWRAGPEDGFLPGRVQLGHAAGAWLAYAVLQDCDIFNPVTTFNEPAFRVGDVFELFLLPPAQSAYFEIHVTPENQRFQVRLDRATVPEGSGRIPDLVPFTSPGIQSRTHVAGGAWQVLLQVPIAGIVETTVADATTWRVSCGRYDYTRGAAAPVISSITPHRECNFHRVHEWMAVELG